MRNYEIMFIFDPALGEAKIKKTADGLKEAVEVLKGKAQIDLWGKKELAYPIKKKNDGVYFLMKVEIEPDALAVFERKLKLREEVMRYLIISLDK